MTRRTLSHKLVGFEAAEAVGDDHIVPREAKNISDTNTIPPPGLTAGTSYLCLLSSYLFSLKHKLWMLGKSATALADR